MKKILMSIFLIMLVMAAVGCGSSNSLSGDTGSIIAQLEWGGTAIANADSEKEIAAAPAGVVTVRIIVNGSGMSAIQKDFDASVGKGIIDGVPAGSDRTLTAQGLDSKGSVIYQGTKANITVVAGQTTDAGIIILSPVSDTTPVEDPFLSATTTLNDIALGLTFDSLGNLYIATVSGNIIKLDGKNVSTFITKGVGGLAYDRHIRFSQGDFYIQNVLNVGTSSEQIDEVLLFNSTGTYIRKLLDEKDIGAYFFEDITVNAQGQLYVAPFTTSNNVVVRIDSNGQNLSTIIQSGGGGVFVPVSLAIDSNGNLYVGTPSGVSKFDGNGKFLGEIVQSGMNGFQYAANLSVDHNNNLYIGNIILGTDANSTRWNVLRFGSNGTFLGEFIKAGTAGLSAFPEDMGFDIQGRLYIADFLGAVNGIVRFDQSGNFDRIGVKNFGGYSSSLMKSSVKSKQQDEKYRHYREIELKNKALTEEFAQRTQSVE